jgi:hypothetical protein
MAHPHLDIYLNDHLAGSQGALELMQRLVESRKDSRVSSTVAEVRAEVLAERQQLEALMDRLQFDKSRSRQAAGWLAEKAAQVKLHLDDPQNGDLRLFESLEAITLGLSGKLALWRALEAVAEHMPELHGIDYPRLVEQSKDQHRRIEELRVRAAKKAFGGHDPTIDED